MPGTQQQRQGPITRSAILAGVGYPVTSDGAVSGAEDVDIQVCCNTVSCRSPNPGRQPTNPDGVAHQTPALQESDVGEGAPAVVQPDRNPDGTVAKVLEAPELNPARVVPLQGGGEVRKISKAARRRQISRVLRKRCM